MKKFVCLISVMLVSLMAFSQTIDKSKFKEVSLFDYLVEEKENKGKEYTVYYKMPVSFSFQSGTDIYFKDENEDTISLTTNKRWNLPKNQTVMIYFSAKHNAYFSFWENETLIDVEQNTKSNVKPWENYIRKNKTGEHGWYLESVGNGIYKEVYIE